MYLWKYFILSLVPSLSPIFQAQEPGWKWDYGYIKLAFIPSPPPAIVASILIPHSFWLDNNLLIQALAKYGKQLQMSEWNLKTRSCAVLDSESL